MGGSSVESFFDVERMDVADVPQGERGPSKQGKAPPQDMPPLVISLGGSLLYGKADGGASLDEGFLGAAAEWLGSVERRFRTYVVVGGGAPAKEMIPRLRRMGATEAALDGLGIAMTRVNAMALRCAMGVPGTEVPRTIDEALAEGGRERTIVMGGTHPGHTTDAVAAMLAETLRAERLIIATNVDGIFTADPNEDPRAVLYDTLTADDLLVMTATAGTEAGSKSPIDPVASRIVARSGVRTIILNGRDLENMEAAVSGRPCRGTLIELTGAPRIDPGTIRKVGERRETEDRGHGGDGEARSEAERAKRPSGRRLLLSGHGKGARNVGRPEPTGPAPAKEGRPDDQEVRHSAGDAKASDAQILATDTKGPKATTAGKRTGKERGKPRSADDIDWDLREDAPKEDAKPEVVKGDRGKGKRQKDEKRSEDWELPSLDEVEPD